MIKSRTLATLKQCLANKGFNEAQQMEIIERGTVKSFGNRAQLVMAPIDVPTVGYQCIEAQI